MTTISGVFFWYIFLRDRVLATPLLMSLILVFLRDVWIRTQRAAVVRRRATNLATLLTHHLATHLPPSPLPPPPNLVTHLPQVSEVIPIPDL